MKRMMIALGGNALGKKQDEQLQLVKETAEVIVKLLKEDYQLIIGHGNGPQVGMINAAFSLGNQVDRAISNMPFPECGAMSQGYIGYHLQQAIQNELLRQQLKRECITVITQVEVNQDDPAFLNPTKPVGKFVDKRTAELLAEKNKIQFMEDAGRGYRQVVASPQPQKIIEAKSIIELINNDVIVITVGGGGIPVVKTGESYQGIAAVIDKDLSSAKLAVDAQAQILLILTTVEQVYINFQKSNQYPLERVSIKELKTYQAAGHFAKGSMLPKIQACIDFVEKTGGQAIITSLAKADLALSGVTGTWVIS